MEFGAGNIGFMLIATALVMLMTPGLAFFYGGLVGSKNVIAVMMHSFLSLGVTTILWYAVGFSLSFSGGEGGVIGNLDWAFLNGVSLTDAWSGAGSIPVVLFFVYQMMFAVITPALITGAFTNRIRFGPFLAFLALWQLFVYYPFAHMIWGGGLLADWGVLDFAGGIVVHATAGMAALGAVLYLGNRRAAERSPHNIPSIALGTALLWFGWFGFNAGSQLVVRRGFDLVEGGSSAADLCDDLFGGLVPDEGLGVVVPVFGPDLDGIDEVGHAGEHASA